MFKCFVYFTWLLNIDEKIYSIYHIAVLNYFILEYGTKNTDYYKKSSTIYELTKRIILL